MVDAPIDYNILLERSWKYAMIAIVSSVFQVFQFLHEGKITTIDQLSFTQKIPNSLSGSNILSIDKSHQVTENIGVGLYPSLMGNFNIASPVLFVGSSSTSVKKEAPVSMIQSFKTNYLDNPWVLMNPSNMREECQYPETVLPLFATEISHQVIQQNTIDIDSSEVEEVDPPMQPIWAVNYFASRDCLDMVLPANEAILEAL